MDEHKQFIRQFEDKVLAPDACMEDLAVQGEGQAQLFQRHIRVVRKDDIANAFCVCLCCHGTIIAMKYE